MTKKNPKRTTTPTVKKDACFSQILCNLGLAWGCHMSIVTKGDAFSPPICLVALLVAKKNHCAFRGAVSYVYFYLCTVSFFSSSAPLPTR
jgi:hypothetical protein